MPIAKQWSLLAWGSVERGPERERLHEDLQGLLGGRGLAAHEPEIDVHLFAAWLEELRACVGPVGNGLIGQLLEEQLRRQSQGYIRRYLRRINRRKQAARFYRWKKRNRLPPLKKK